MSIHSTANTTTFHLFPYKMTVGWVVTEHPRTLISSAARSCFACVFCSPPPIHRPNDELDKPKALKLVVETVTDGLLHALKWDLKTFPKPIKYPS